MAGRFTSGTGDTPGGNAYMDELAAHVDTFYNAAAFILTGIAGTADDPTGVVTPILDVGLVAGMNFHYTAIANNGGAMTMRVGAETAVAIVTAANAALAADDVVSGTTYILHYDGTAMRIMSDKGLVAAGATMSNDVFTASGTLTKPAGFPDDGLVIIDAWAGGAGGSGNAGGGGGGYNRRSFFGVDLGTTETVTIGAGGAASTAGGDTSVGSLVAAFGGGKGGSTKGGGGGGQLTAGGSGGATPDGGAPFGGEAIAGIGGSGNAGAGGQSAAGGDGIWGGGGGSHDSGAGGNSLFGGGGGSGSGASGGSSVFGGDGGASGVGGVIPAGGGGKNSSVGARGEVRVRWIS